MRPEAALKARLVVMVLDFAVGGLALVYGVPEHLGERLRLPIRSVPGSRHALFGKPGADAAQRCPALIPNEDFSGYRSLILPHDVPPELVRDVGPPDHVVPQDNVVSERGRPAARLFTQRRLRELPFRRSLPEAAALFGGDGPHDGERERVAQVHVAEDQMSPGVLDLPADALLVLLVAAETVDGGRDKRVRLAFLDERDRGAHALALKQERARLACVLKLRHYRQTQGNGLGPAGSRLAVQAGAVLDLFVGTDAGNDDCAANFGGWKGCMHDGSSWIICLIVPA